MGRKWRILVALWIVGWSFLMWGEKTTNPELAVFVNNSANAPQRMVVAAEQTAGRILHQAGVDVRWVNCGAKGPSNAQCGEIPRLSLVVHLISHARTLGDDIFGVSFMDRDVGSYADLFFEPIERLHEVNRDSSLTTILGDVLAHELGHLLLGRNAHSGDGIMQPHWTKEQLLRGDMGWLRFSEEQSLRIRSRVAAMQINEHDSATLEAVNR